MCLEKGSIPWNFVHGLLENAIYGGRVDNPFDMRVMVSYLKSFFNSNVLGEGGKSGRKLGPLQVPVSTQFKASNLKIYILNLWQ